MTTSKILASTKLYPKLALGGNLEIIPHAHFFNSFILLKIFSAAALIRFVYYVEVTD